MSNNDATFTKKKQGKIAKNLYFCESLKFCNISYLKIPPRTKQCYNTTSLPPLLILPWEKTVIIKNEKKKILKNMKLTLIAKTYQIYALKTTLKRTENLPPFM